LSTRGEMRIKRVELGECDHPVSITSLSSGCSHLSSGCCGRIGKNNAEG
jgi:hypothetical protein